MSETKTVQLNYMIENYRPPVNRDRDEDIAIEWNLAAVGLRTIDDARRQIAKYRAEYPAEQWRIMLETKTITRTLECIE